MRYVYSGTSGAASLQQFVESNVYHRQGKAKLSFSIFVFFFSPLVYTSDDGDYSNKCVFTVIFHDMEWRKLII